MISFYETVGGKTWAVVLNEKGDVVTRRQVPFKKAPYLGVWELKASNKGNSSDLVRH
jgi:hypothetical protein